MQLIAYNFHHKKPAWTIQKLSKNTGISEHALMILMPALLEKGLITTTGKHNDQYLPCSSLENISLEMIINAARNAEESHSLRPDDVESAQLVNETATCIDNAIAEAVKGKTLKDLI
jgi:DNA-binding IscR family transcriptional regulator